MGQYHKLVNLDKKQFVHPHQIGNGLKMYEQIGWDYCTATALAMLLASACQGGARGGGDFHSGSDSKLVGSWAGDRIAFVGDYAEENDLPGDDDPEAIYKACSDTPEDGWTNISADVRKMMETEFGITYEGEGWLEIKTKAKEKSAPQLAPDIVLTAPATRN